MHSSPAHASFAFAALVAWTGRYRPVLHSPRSTNVFVLTLHMSTLFTIRQLAARAGVSRATVSLALRNDPRVAIGTRESVAQIAKECGYERDPVVSCLMNRLRVKKCSRVKEKIAFLTFWNTAEGWKNNTTEMAYFQGACARAQEFGYEIEHFWAKDPGINADYLSRVLYTRSIRGVVLSSLPGRAGHVSLNWTHFCTAAVSLTSIRPCMHRASHDYGQGMRLVLRNLKRKGYRRIGYVNSALFENRARGEWLAAFLTYQHQLPSQQQVPPILIKEWNLDPAKLTRKSRWRGIGEHAIGRCLEWGPDGFIAWLNRYQPDVLISSTSQALRFVRHLGLRVPEDIGFASLHRLLDSDLWAGIDRVPEKIGSAAVDLVVGQLQNNEFGLPVCPRTVLLGGIWKEGPTLRNMR